MTENSKFFPKISLEFCSESDNQEMHQKSVFHSNHVFYAGALKNILENTLPKELFEGVGEDPASFQKAKKALNEVLPLLTSSLWSEKPTKMSFFLLSKYRSNSFRFFLEMISHWLIPGKRFNILQIYAGDFTFPEFGTTVYTVSEIMIQVQNQEEYQQIQSNLPIIETEIRLGMQSSFYASRILEIKGLTADEKTALIQEHITTLAEKLPKEFDQDVITEMQHFLVMCRDDFKAARDCRLLSRIISYHYLFRKSLREAVKQSPTHRHLSLKLFRSMIQMGRNPKKVLGVIVGINFLKDKEIFEQKHLFNAIRTYIPKCNPIENSFFANRRGVEQICTFYLEVEKEGGAEFTSKEINLLRQELPSHLKDSIEYLMHPVFMPRNEEEIMRNILSLSNQIKYLRDIPQVYISFDEQTHKNLFFNVILVRIINPNTPSISIQELFKKSGSFLTYIHDRAKIVGSLRKKYPKEVTVFRLKVCKEQFLRRDHSINLYEARQAVVLELLRVVGDFRDFNGGIISKQKELISTVKSLLEGNFKYHDLILENFFYSLNPVIMRTILQPDVFKTLFAMLLQAISQNFEKEKQPLLDLKIEKGALFILVKSTLRQVKDLLQKVFFKQSIASTELVNGYLHMHGIHYIGYIYKSDNHEKQKLLSKAIEESLFA